jgi:hypothetical protein
LRPDFRERNVIKLRNDRTLVADPVEALIIDLLEWIGPRPRPYAEVMDAWRTSCPRLPVWEEANARGYITRQHSAAAGALVSVSPLGLDVLRQHRRSRATSAERG